MRVFYYSQSYYSPTGSGVHSKEFVQAFSNLPEVEHIEVFSGKTYSEQEESITAGGVTKRRHVKIISALKNFLRRFLPCSCEAFILIFLSPLSKYAALKKAIQASKSDVIVLRLTTEFLWISKIKRDFPELTSCIELNAVVIDELWSDMWFEKFWRNLEARHLAFADYITVVSKHLKNYYIRQGIAPEKILVNQNGVNPGVFRFSPGFDCDKVRVQFGIPKSAFVLGYVGGMQRFRRLPEVIEKIAEMRKNDGNDVFLLLVGDGEDMARIKAKIRKNKGIFKGWIRLAGTRAYEEIPDIIRIFDLAIFPFSNPYGSPIKLFEYLAMGIPTIGPDVPVVRETFQNNKHLRLVSQNGNDFIAAVRELKNSPIIRDKLAKMGQDYVLKFYTWEANAKRVYEYVNRFNQGIQ